MRLLAATLALVVVTAHAAEPLSAQDLAKVNREMKKAADAVAKKYGDKKLSADERKAMMNEQAQATRAVLEKNNLDAKDVARATAKNGKDVEAASADLDAKEAEAAKKSPGTAPAAGAPAGSADADANEAAAMDQAKGIGKKK